MASAPQQPSLPLFYNDLMPLNTRDHSNFKSKTLESAKWLAAQHAIPLTVDEFVQAQRDFPIVFSSGDNPLPLALMGLNEGVNTFVDDEGKINDPIYLPAYIRRYPFLLAKLNEDSDDLSLCFDPTAESIGEFEDGEPMFNEDGSTTQPTKNILEFCEKFEEAGLRTKAFVDQLKENDLLMDGEISIERVEMPGKPYVYRGFQMINQEKLREVKGETLETWNQNGMMALIYGHLFSLDLMRSIFARQVNMGKVPEPAEEAAV
ncbi:SapC family protein [Parerythrobacter jejuensis]|uniref:Multidrug transporter n=1 Tax=Parerythrobacter jejuensis TaxID=795812 RepID=A0A845AVX5_9SPHN|nr:SapC family protein [Parerythrobacter jejuensis]MXP32656.1 multidrug transporter [Parerythrobacter jejuensis]